MTRSASVESFVETVGIAELRDALGKDALFETVAADFHLEEQSEWGQRPIQSIAGRLALKSAVCELVKKHFPDLCLRRQDVIIDATLEGAPKISEIAAGDIEIVARLKSSVWVSISHSRTHAAGMASIWIEGIS